MNKRIRKKYLSDEEKLLLKLFAKGGKVNVYKYDCESQEAESFVALVNPPQYTVSGTFRWFYANKGEIRCAAFLKEEV